MVKSLWRVLVDGITSFSRHGGTLLGGATAFFALLSAAPLMLIVLGVAIPLAGEKLARAELYRSMLQWFGAEGASTLLGLADGAMRNDHGTLASVIGSAVLLYGATNLFLQMQQALNQIWNVRQRSDLSLRVSAFHLLRRRLLAFVMVLLCVASLLASLAMRTTLAVLRSLSGQPIPIAWHLLDHTISLVGLIAMIASLFRILPDARIAWRDVWLGAVTTAVLFDAGREVLAVYFGRIARVTGFGAAGSIVLLLLWVHYSAQIFYFGAALTASWAAHRGRPVRPTEDAVAIPAPEG